MPDPRSITLHGHVLSYTDTYPQAASRADDPIDNPATDGRIAGPAADVPVLFVHGLMGSSSTWAAQSDRLGRRLRVIAPDLFGHGASAKPPGDYSLSAHAATLRDLLDALRIQTVTVVGHSLGGGVALQLAYLFPERVAALVLVSSGGLGRDLNPLLRAATLPGSELVLPLIASSWLHDVGDTALRYWSMLGLPPVSPSTDEAWRSLSSLADGPTRSAFLATSRAVINFSGQTVTARNRMPGLAGLPSLLIWGARDRIVPPSHVEFGRSELPGAQVEIFDRSGHFPHLDEPDRFSRVLDEFLSGAFNRSAAPACESAATTPGRRPSRR